MNFWTYALLFAGIAALSIVLAAFYQALETRAGIQDAIYKADEREQLQRMFDQVRFKTHFLTELSGTPGLILYPPEIRKLCIASFLEG